MPQNINTLLSEGIILKLYDFRFIVYAGFNDLRWLNENFASGFKALVHRCIRLPLNVYVIRKNIR